MILRGLAPLALLLACATPASGAGEPGGPRVVVGTAHVTVRGTTGEVSSHLAFAAAIDPALLRLELVRGGQAVAVLWWEAGTLSVLALTDPPLLHEGPATRATLEAALRLPFCPEELLFALRGGESPVPACSGAEASEVVTRAGRIVGLRRPGETGPGLIDFSAFSRGEAGDWPRRIVLRAPEGTAELRILARHARELPPPRPAGRAWDLARRASAEDVARELGLVKDREP